MLTHCSMNVIQKSSSSYFCQLNFLIVSPCGNVAILPSFFRKNRQNFYFSRNKSYNIDLAEDMKSYVPLSVFSPKDSSVERGTTAASHATPFQEMLLIAAEL